MMRRVIGTALHRNRKHVANRFEFVPVIPEYFHTHHVSSTPRCLWTISSTRENLLQHHKEICRHASLQTAFYNDVHTRRWSSSAAVGTKDEGLGEECYEKAMEALRQIELAERQEEEQRAKEQYEAMQRSHDKEAERTKLAAERRAERLERKGLSQENVEQAAVAAAAKKPSFAGGVAVVKTIVRQTRKKHREKQEKEVSFKDNNWQQIALELLEEAAYRHGYPKALVRLGNDALDEIRNGVPDMDPLSIESLLQPFHVDDFEGMRDNYRNMNPVERAVRLYHLAGVNGKSPEGYFNLGHILWTGCPETSDNAIIPPDIEKSLWAFEKAIELGDADAMYFVGVHRMSLHGEDRHKGLALIKMAADYHHGGALYYLALLHRNGDTELALSPSLDTFREFLEKATACHDPDALFLRAHCMFHGEDGYVQNYRLALDGFLESASAGNPDGANSAGAMLHTGGYGGEIKKDQIKAFELYQEAAEMGSIEGWRNVVACYALGQGVPKCERTAEYIAKTMLKE